MPLLLHLGGSNVTSLEVLRVEEEYLELFKVKRPYSLDVGEFKAMVELNFVSSGLLNDEDDDQVSRTTETRVTDEWKVPKETPGDGESSSHSLDLGGVLPNERDVPESRRETSDSIEQTALALLVSCSNRSSASRSLLERSMLVDRNAESVRLAVL